MIIKTPSISQTIGSLLRADFAVQWKQRRSPLMATMLAVVLLVTWKNFATMNNGPQILLASCITIVLMGMGLLGYPNSVARDREKGVFQRLRVTPAPTWTIMLSRLMVQVFVMAIMTCVVLFIAFLINKITLSMGEYVLTIIAAMVCGGVFLAIGQMLVGLIKSSETVNAAGRFIYFPLVFGGALAELGILGDLARKIVEWSPYGTVQSVLQASINVSSWNGHVWMAFLLTLLYALFFVAIGIKKFRWNI